MEGRQVKQLLALTKNHRRIAKSGTAQEREELLRKLSLPTSPLPTLPQSSEVQCCGNCLKWCIRDMSQRGVNRGLTHRELGFAATDSCEAFVPKPQRLRHSVILDTQSMDHSELLALEMAIDLRKKTLVLATKSNLRKLLARVKKEGGKVQVSWEGGAGILVRVTQSKVWCADGSRVRVDSIISYRFIPK